MDTALLFRNRRLPKATLGSLGTPTRRAVKTPCKAGGVLPRHGRFIFRKSGACQSLLSFLKRPPKQRRNPRQSRHIPPGHGRFISRKHGACRKSLLSFLKHASQQRRNPRQSRHIPPRHGHRTPGEIPVVSGAPPVLLDLILGVRRGLLRCQPFDSKTRACQGSSQRRRNNYWSITVITCPYSGSRVAVRRQHAINCRNRPIVLPTLRAKRKNRRSTPSQP